MSLVFLPNWTRVMIYLYGRDIEPDGGDLSISDVARELYIPRRRISDIQAELFSKGLLLSKRDGRRKSLRLSANGRIVAHNLVSVKAICDM